jgi:phosphoribosyl-ATP pyrophosphohydrolase/phosphoribosyl-AMP cyclohydrolase
MPRPATRLIPVIAQDAATNNVLMLAWADARALAKTKKTGFMHYWSRSRGKLWRKGETSGHVQKLVSLHYDCDRDTILARVRQTGPACHKGTYSCFAKAPFPAGDILEILRRTFEDRRRRPKKGSYTNAMLKNRDQLLKKIGEEAAELIVALKGKRRDRAVSEAADLLFHYVLTLFAFGLSLDDVKRELERRHK